MYLQIWFPILRLAHPSKEISDVFTSQDKVRVYSNGMVVFQPSSVFNTRCDINIYKYPFDSQMCEISFLPLTYFQHEVALILEQKAMLFMNGFKENDGWRITGSNAFSSNFGFSYITYELHLQRRSEFFLINILLPILVISFLSCLSFLIPHECGERISFTVTVLLSFAVCITMVSNNIPKTSAPVALLSYFLFILYLSVVFVMLLTTFNSRMFHRSTSKRVPAFFRYLVLRLRCASKALRTSNSVDAFLEPELDTTLFVVTENKETSAESDKETHKKETFHNTSEEPVTWIDVAKTLDLLCFSFYLFCYVCIFFGIFMHIL